MTQLRIAAVLTLCALAARAEDVDDSIATYVDLVEHAKASRLGSGPSLSERMGVSAISAGGGVANYHKNPAKHGTQWDDFLPIWGKKLRAKGIDLPRPMGVGLNVAYSDRDVFVTDLKVSFDGGPYNDVSNFVAVRANAKAWAGLLRYDFWLLPMLNFYVLGGWTTETSDAKVTVDIDPPGPLPPRSVSFDIPGKRSGPTYGAGLNAAVGYKWVFGDLNLNWSKTDLGFEGDLSTFLASLRIGGFVNWGPGQLRLWIGTTYWNLNNTVADRIELSDVTIDYIIEEEAVDTWTAIVGGSYELKKNFQFVAEVQWASATLMFTGSFTYRF